MALFMGSGRVVPITLTNYTNNQSKSGFTPSTESIIVRPDVGYTGLGQVTIEAIPTAYVIPTGTLNMGAYGSGTHNVYGWASASVPAMPNPTYSFSFESSVCRFVGRISVYSGFNPSSQIFSSTYQLSTINGFTIIPTDTSQIIAESYKWTLGSIICEAIPSSITVYKSVYEKTVDDNGLILFLDSTKLIVSSYFFCNCENITTLSNSTLISIYDSAFMSCFNLTTVNCPNATRVNPCAFMYCSNLTTVNLPMLSYLSGSTFYYCSRLVEISLPNVSIVQNGAFSQCTALTSVYLPNAISFNGEYNFYSCSNLVTLSVPELTYIYGSDFQYCRNLEVLSFPKLSKIGYYASCFAGCSKLKSVYLMNSSMVYMSTNYSNWQIFDQSPMVNSTYLSGSYGSIYVPSSLLTTYQNDSGWSRIADRFVGI